MVDKQVETVKEFIYNKFYQDSHRIVKFMESKGTVYC